MEKNQQQQRIVFIKQDNLCKTGFTSYEDAKKVADTVKQDGATRVRVLFRSRTGKYDVVVKKAQQKEVV